MIKDISVRLATAIGFSAWVLGSLYYNKWSYVLLFIIIAFACSYEYYRVILKDSSTMRNILHALFVACLPLLAYISIESDISILYSMLAVTGLVIFSVFTLRLNGPPRDPIGFTAPLISGASYIGLPCMMAIFIAYLPGTFTYLPLMGVIPLIWANDTGAYLTGSMLGKTPLYPAISPKKTVEGTLGGWIICILCAFPLSKLNPVYTLQEWLLIAALTGLAAIVGDLIESKFKRYYSIKDTGTFLPGHGGFLDRFDSFLYLMPYIYAYSLINTLSN